MGISIIFSFLFFYRINPIDPSRVDLDASCFFVIGRAILNGKMPYIDFVDNKGPITYLLYAFSSLFGNFPWGIILISSVLVFISLIVLVKICEEIHINSFIALLLYLFFYVCICTAGGFTEDMSLPLTLIAFWLLLKIEKNVQENKSSSILEVLLFVSFWICAMTRINNAISIGVIIVSLGIYFIIKNEWKHLFYYILNFLIGTVIVLTPIFIWLGISGALKEFLFQFLLNNFKYSGAQTAMTKSQLFISVFGFKLAILLLAGLFGSIVYKIKNQSQSKLIYLTVISVNLITALSFVTMTQQYDHYMLVIFIPSFFGFILQFSNLENQTKSKNYFSWNKLISAFLCLCILVTSTGGAGLTKNFVYGVLNRETINSSKLLSGVDLNVKKTFNYTCEYISRISNRSLFDGNSYQDELNEFASFIPQNERDSVFGLNIMPDFYAFTGITPCKRIFVCQDLFTDISDEYREEFISYFEINPPKWLVSSVPVEHVSLCNLGAELIEKYNRMDTGSNLFYLYKLGE